MKIIDIVRLIYRKLYALRAPFYLREDKRYSRYDIGEYTYGAPTILSKHAGVNLKIGRFCAIAEGVKIHLGGEHSMDWITTYPFDVVFDRAKKYNKYDKSKGDVIIGHDVWIGSEAMILSGVTIGNGAVIGARSVVTKDVDPYSVVAGNPARHVRYRFDSETIALLEQIAWWNWPINKIEEAWRLLLSSDIRSFVDTFMK
jgi:acetyltransferase-like isoleucine patch superfamily enzyme